MKHLEIGDLVKVNTPAGIVDGIVCHSWRGANTNQVCVEFNYTGSGYKSIQQNFSRKTGKKYGHRSRVSNNECKLIIE